MDTRLNAPFVSTDGSPHTSHDVLGLYDGQLATASLYPDAAAIRTLGYCLKQPGTDHWVVQRQNSIEQIHLYSRQEVASFIRIQSGNRE